MFLRDNVQQLIQIFYTLPGIASPSDPHRVMYLDQGRLIRGFTGRQKVPQLANGIQQW
jgi:hypothetical protein